MHNRKIVYLDLIIISASIICFEIVATRISSVIFVSDYAFFILSLAILGIGSGGFFHDTVKEQLSFLGNE